MNFKALREGLFKARREKNALPRYLARRFLFKPLERLGLHVVGDHFYEPIPNLRELAANYDGSRRDIPGHDLRLEAFEPEHAARLERFGPEFQEAVKAFGFDPSNYYFRGADAVSYYALLREMKPASVVEIGQGSSTRCSPFLLPGFERRKGAGGMDEGETLPKSNPSPHTIVLPSPQRERGRG